MSSNRWQKKRDVEASSNLTVLLWSQLTGTTGPEATGAPRPSLHLPYTRKLTCWLASLLAAHGRVPAWLGACAGDPTVKRRRTSEKALADCCGPTESVTEMLAKKRPRT